MGDGEKASLRLQFNPKVRLAFHGATITTDAGLLAFREFDDALGLTEIAEDYLQESRTGRNILHHLVPLLRQSIYSRLAGYDDTNDAVRLSQDPAMRVIVGWQGLPSAAPPVCRAFPSTIGTDIYAGHLARTFSVDMNTPGGTVLLRPSGPTCLRH